MDYQMEKALGKCFRSKSDDSFGFIRVFGIPYTYKVTEGITHKNTMLEIIGYTNRDLLVRVNPELTESDVNCIDG